MLDLHRLRLLHELHARGTIAAVAEALRYTPSAVSQQLAVLEREAGVQLLEPAGRGVRLTDAALVLVDHARALLERAALAEAELAAASVTVAGRARVASFQSAALRLVMPAMRALERAAPRLRARSSARSRAIVLRTRRPSLHVLRLLRPWIRSFSKLGISTTRIPAASARTFIDVSISNPSASAQMTGSALRQKAL